MDIPCFYGLRSWNAWKRLTPDNLRRYRTTPQQNWSEKHVLDVSSYTDLFKVVAFLTVMNKTRRLAFRGQDQDLEPTPTLLRGTWKRATNRQAVDLVAHRDEYWEQLPEACARVTTVLKGRLPRHRPFEHFEQRPELRVAPWSVLQHYELWPTPLLDLTTSLRVAASFALGLPTSRKEGFLYVFALNEPKSDVMRLRVDTRDVAIRLSAVCPPDTLRPHLQEAILVGNPNFQKVDLDKIDPDGASTSPVRDRLVARFRLIDAGTTQDGFWLPDFPKHTKDSLFPRPDEIRESLVNAMKYRTEAGRLVIG